MPFMTHDVFDPVADENVAIWRYMDFTKLVAMLDSKCLFFSRADKVGDPFEGSLPRKNIEMVNSIPTNTPLDQLDHLTRVLIHTRDWNHHFPRYTGLNCWHLNSHESAAMWSLYLKSNEGIAVKSTFRRLRECIRDDDEHVYAGRVKYIDYESEMIVFKERKNFFAPFAHKRLSFQHEKEIRAMISRWPYVEATKKFDWNLETIDAGINIRVDLGVLVEEIRLAPTAPGWLESLVKSVCETYGFVFPVRRSDLLNDPMF
jgi:hypothetical protein